MMALIHDLEKCRAIAMRNANSAEDYEYEQEQLFLVQTLFDAIIELGVIHNKESDE